MIAPAPRDATSTLRGRVEAVFYSNPKFSAGRLVTASGDRVSFAGSLMVRENDPVVLQGSWEAHPKYGRQFKVKSFCFDEKPDAGGLAHYLASHPDIKGIGPIKAQRIAAAFAEDFDRVIEKEPERVARVARIPMATVTTLRTEWLRRRALNVSFTWLASFGLSYVQMTKLVDKFENGIVAMLAEDPYRLVHEVEGFGFKRVDVVAQKMGTPKEHASRIRAGVVHSVADQLDQGDCWVDYEVLIDLANSLLVMDVEDSRQRIERALDGLIHEGELACVSVGGRFLVAQPHIHKMETDLARALSVLPGPNPHFAGAEGQGLDGSDGLDAFIREMAPDLNAAQLQAVQAAVRHRIVLISGGAGTGKTKTVKAIFDIYRERGLEVALAAPTGKAAKRLEEVVGHKALTIHRLLSFNGESFDKDQDNPLDAAVVVIDEFSLVDVPLAWHLLRAIGRRTALVLVGDHNQLPPVGPGNPLRDLIEQRPIPTVILDEVVRQAGVLKENSIAILRGEVRPTAPAPPGKRASWCVVDRLLREGDVEEYIHQLYDRVLSDRLGFDLLRDVQLLTPTRKGPLGTAALNIVLQRLIQKRLWGVDVSPLPEGRRPRLLQHDRVIQMKNDYTLGVMNGAIGHVFRLGPQPGQVEVAFDDRHVLFDAQSAEQLSLAYAITIHKSQGSQYPCAVVVIHKAHSFMHHRNLFYTGVTRAQHTVVIVGDHWGIRNCATRQQIEKRKTFLSVLELDQDVLEIP